MITVIDTDALLGLFVPQDVHHTRAVRLLEELNERRCEIVISPTTVGEFALLASSRIGLSQTKETIKCLTGPAFRTVAIPETTTQDVADLYLRQTSKEESMFDCFVMVVAQAVGADCICSFDGGYRKNGFVLAEDLLAHSVR